MQIAIYSRTGSEQQEQRLLQVVEILRRRAKIVLYEPLYEQMSAKHGLRLADHELFGSTNELNGSTTCIVSVGGDGTMLDAAALAAHSGVPIIGFSTGRLGFLPALNENSLEDAINSILHGDFEVDYRTMLQMDGCLDGTCIALNDICVQKRGSPIAEIGVAINGEFLCNYWADGLIISTPTGSTAYSLSAGGPIVNPRAACFVVMPIAAHNLNVRPVVVPDSSTISIEMHTRSRTIVVSADSKEFLRSDDIKLVVKKFSRQVGFVKLRGMSFYHTLREKLHWGVETRHSSSGDR